MTGQCLCGTVRFAVDEPFVSSTICHCTNCKKISGGAGTVNARARTSAIRLLAGEEHVRTFQPTEDRSLDRRKRPPDRRLELVMFQARLDASPRRCQVMRLVAVARTSTTRMRSVDAATARGTVSKQGSSRLG